MIRMTKFAALAIAALLALTVTGGPAEAKRPHNHHKTSYIVCPAGTELRDGVCVEPAGERVVCPAGTLLLNEVCVKP